MTRKTELEALKSLLAEGATSQCQNCGGDVKLDNCKLEEFEEGKLYLMEDVPGLVCQECGEMWIPEPFMKEFEKMIQAAKTKHRKKK